MIINIDLWGNDGSYLNRSGAILGALLNLHCIKMNKSGEPAHPLYLKADLKPVPMGTWHCVEQEWTTISWE